MEASLQLQGAEEPLTEQAPKTEPLIPLQQSDGGRPIKPQKVSPEENGMDHQNKYPPAQDHDKEPSIEKPPQSEQLYNTPSVAPSQHHLPETFPSKERTEEAPAEKILSEPLSEQHQDKPSILQEPQNETCIEKNVVDTELEQEHATPAVVEEHHKEEDPVSHPLKHHHDVPLPAHEHHKEPLVENNTDSFTQQQFVKPFVAHDHHKEGTIERNFRDSNELESLADTPKKVNPKDITAEQFSEAESTESETMKLSTPQQQSVSPAVLSEDHKQHRKDVQEETNAVVELPSLHQHIDPTVDQHLDNVSNGHKQFSQPSETKPLDLSTEQNLSVSLQHFADDSTRHHPTPSLEQNQAVPHTEQCHGKSSLKEDVVKFLTEQTGSSALSQQEANEGQVGISSPENPHLETSLPTEINEKLADEPTTKQPQIFNLESQKPTRAVIDTAAPFESVKAAVSLFGQRVDWKSQLRIPQVQVGSSLERCTLPEPELQKAQEDLVYYKDKLAFTQASTAGVLLELKKVKSLIQNPATKQQGTDLLPSKSMEAVDASNPTGTASAEKPANLELPSVLREMGSAKEELISATTSKEAAVKGLQDCLSSLESVLKRVDELETEKAFLDEAVGDAHIALADAEEQVSQLKSGQKVDLINSMPGDFMETKSAEIKSLESKLEETTLMITNLKQELLASKQAESVTVAAASESEQKMVKVKLELEQAKSEELGMVARLAKVLEETDELKPNLEKATQESNTLSSTIESLKADVEQVNRELDSGHEKEQIACATLASLQDELHKVKEALQSARAGEARALEAKDTLPASIKQAASEADEAKAAAKGSKEAAHRTRQEIEQVKAATSTALSRHQAALKELEAAKASEAMASADLKALEESETQGADTESELEGVMGITITLEEYSALKQAGVEAEGLADKRVAEVIAHVEEAKANHLRAQSKLDDIAKEAEKCREELQSTQKHADDAQEAKLTAEADLRKWRAEHDQRRKSGVSPLDLKAGSNQSSPRKLSSNEKAYFQPVTQEKQGVVPPVAHGKRVAGRDTLAQIMSPQVPTSEWYPGEDSMMRNRDKVKKKNFIRRVASIVASKKKP